MFIIGRNLPYLQTAISSGLDSVSQGIVQTTQQQGIEALDKAINTFSSGEANAQDLFVTQTQSQVSAPADFPDPTSFLGNQEGTGEVLNFLRDSKFSAGSELNNFSKTFLNQFARIQTNMTSEQAASLNNMRDTVGRISNLQQSLDAQFYAGRLGGPGFGLLQNKLLQKASDRVSSEMTFKPADPSFDNLPLLPKASNLFVRDGTDVNEVNVNDVEHFRSGPPWIMSSIAAVARQNPESIKNMIQENADGTYTVTFPGGRKATVTTNFTSNFDAPPNQNEIWPLLIEKAVLQTIGSASVADTLNLLTGSPATTKKARVPGGWVPTPYYSGYLFNEMKKDFDSGNAIVLQSHGGPQWLQGEDSEWKPGPHNSKGVPKGGEVITKTYTYYNPSQDFRHAFTVSNMYTDKEGKGWVEVEYPGTRPDWLPANPIPFDTLTDLYQNAYISPTNIKGTQAIEADTTNVREIASERYVFRNTEAIEAKTTNAKDKASEIK